MNNCVLFFFCFMSALDFCLAVTIRFVKCLIHRIVLFLLIAFSFTCTHLSFFFLLGICHKLSFFMLCYFMLQLFFNACLFFFLLLTFVIIVYYPILKQICRFLLLLVILQFCIPLSLFPLVDRAPQNSSYDAGLLVVNSVFGWESLCFSFLSKR